MKIGYARVSTKDQSLDLQIDALKAADCERVYQEVASGAKQERPILEEALASLKKGDTFMVWKLDRLGRSLVHLVKVVDELTTKGIDFVSLNDPIDTTTAHGRLIFGIFAALAGFERDLIRERTNAGLKAARARGRLGGRPKGLSASAKEKAFIVKKLYENRSMSVDKIARQLNITKPTLYNYLKYFD